MVPSSANLNKELLETIDTPDDWLGGNPKKAFQAIGILFALGKACVNSVLSYDAIGLISSNPTAQTVGSALVVLPILALNINANIITMGDIFDSGYNKIRGTEQNNYIQKHHPLLSYIIPVSVLFFSCFSPLNETRVGYEMIRSSIFSPTAVFIACLSLCSATMFEYYYGSKIINQTVVEYSIKSKNLPKTLALIDSLKDLKKAVSIGAINVCENISVNL